MIRFCHVDDAWSSFSLMKVALGLLSRLIILRVVVVVVVEIELVLCFWQRRGGWSRDFEMGFSAINNFGGRVVCVGLKLAFIIVLIDAQAVINLNLSKHGRSSTTSCYCWWWVITNFREQIEKRWCVFIIRMVFTTKLGVDKVINGKQFKHCCFVCFNRNGDRC